MSDQPLYPLKFEPIYKAKVWGGRALAALGRDLPDEGAIGESWELADLSQSSATGGGGGQERSIIANGPLAGRSLHEVMNRYGKKLMGRLEPTAEGNFPLLVKYLDAKENLSVQVHPSPAYAATHVEAHLKSEAWYIVEAQPGAAIYKGIVEGVTAEQFEAAIESGDRAAVEKLLIRVPVKAGDCHYLPSGTCHALGAGIVVAEVQTPSDTTFRVYDWGRTDRALHVKEALLCMTFGPPNVREFEKRTHMAGMFAAVTRLVLCEHFRIEKVRMHEGFEQELPYDQPAVWMVLQGRAVIDPGNGAEAVEIARGDTLLIPAYLDDAKVKLAEDTVWLEVTFPQALGREIA